MNPKISPEHLHRDAVVYVRQSTPGQVLEYTESKRRQYALADSARQLGFVSVSIIDDDLGRSGSGLVERPGFQKLVGAVCSGKGTMSEYELNLLRQRGLAARDAKARRGELRFALPPGFCWDELGRTEHRACQDRRAGDHRTPSTEF